MRRLDLTNRKFGRLTAIEYVADRRWRCICDCGTERIVQGKHLREGHTTSCGCYKIDAMRWYSPRHGHARADGHSPTHNSWQAMLNRCRWAKHKDYHNYGGRGITVCERWQTFVNFLADMGERPANKTLDRINGDLGYFPENCRWATQAEQSRNRRRRSRT